MKQRICVIAAAWIFCGAGTFSASSLADPILRLDFEGATGKLFKAGHDDVRITLNQGEGGKITDLQVRAGLFHGSADVDASTFDAKSLFRSEDEVLAYCVDVLHLLSYGDTYRIEEIKAGQEDNRDGVRRDFGRMITFLGAVNTVLQDDYEFTFGSKNWLNPDPDLGWMSGAIQVGIWESLYEKANTNLSLIPTANGSNEWFSATGVKSAGGSFLTKAFGLVNTDVNGITVPVDPRDLRLARIDDNQDLLLDPQQVPLPGTLLLLLGGLGGLLLRRRRAS